ncbi:MAG TPA: N,N-dimethylformamidase beta subunit family domain-containing protein [Solirubrobacterales bacterium]
MAQVGTRLRGLLLSVVLGVVLLLLIPLQAGANPITDENALTGTPQATWYREHAELTTISGYSTKTTVAPGESIGFAVSAGMKYRVVIYRLGWYGGTGARQVACLPSCTTDIQGVVRSTPAPNSITGEIDDNWPVQPGISMTIPANWTTGEYIAEYVVTSGGNAGQARYSPFVVRSAAPQAQASKILVVVPQNTYLAYNKVGGTSAYVNETNGSVYNKEHATKISLNRPYHTREWSNWDYPLTRFLEREGYDVSYVTDADVDANPNILQQHQMAIISGHSEYWTKNMRDGFQAARDNGVSLFFAGANDSFWQVRYEDSGCADNDTVCNNPGDRRTMVIYKMREDDPIDPISDPSLKTIRFRELDRSECEIQGGVQWTDPGYFPDDGYANMTVTSAGAADPWVQGTGLTTGSTIVGMAGTEFDSFWPDCQTPAAPKILFQYQSQSHQFPADIDSASVKYQTPSSGARVFSSGNLHFPFTLDSWRWNPSLFTGIPAQDTRMQAFTRNVLADLQRPAPPTAIGVSQVGSSVQTTVTPRNDPHISSYKIYRHAGTSAFVPTDVGVTLVCQNPTGSCSDNPPSGTYRYAAVAVDQWNDSEVALSNAFTAGQPTAANDSATASEDAAATAIDVLANDTDQGTGKTISSASDPANGSVVLTGGTAGAHTGLTYQPDANYCNNPPGSSTDSFTYTLNGVSTATVSVTVNCVDDGPVAVNDSISLTEDSGTNTRTVTTNDTDIDGGPKTVTAVTQGANGTVSIGADTAQVIYTPASNYCNTPPGTTLDTFTYTLNGGSTATVSVTVNCDDDPPVAVNDSATFAEDAAAAAITVLGNDTDIDGGPKTISSASDPANGTVVLTGGTAGARTGLTYQPNANYCNSAPGTPDTFTYTLNGGSIATVSVTVTCADDPPLAVDDSIDLQEDSGPNTRVVTSNDTDIDGGPKTIASVTQPGAGQGTVTISSDSLGIIYTPASNYCNNPPGSSPDTFTYTINGGDTATVSVTVTCVDDPPVAVDDTATVGEDASATAITVLSNDTDIDSGPKTISSAADPANGTVVLTGGSPGARTGLTYEPDPDYCNTPSDPTDDFTYTLNGGDTATVSLTVTCVDDPPVANDDTVNVNVDQGSVPVDLLINDTDIDGGPKSISSFTQPTHGSLTGTGTTNAWSSVTYHLSASYCDTALPTSTDSFNYAVNGGDPATVTVTIDCTNPPTAATASATVGQTAAATAIPVLSNDNNSDGGRMMIVDTTVPANGTVAITGSGSGLTYKPDPSYCNTPSGPTDNFNYTLNGGSIAMVAITVPCPTVTSPQQEALPTPPVTKCKKGFKKVKGKAKCRKKKRKRS